MNQERTPQPRLPDYAATLKRAAALVGGYSELAAQLEVSQPELDYWICELGMPPRTVFFHAIDIIIQNAGASRSEAVLD